MSNDKATKRTAKQAVSGMKRAAIYLRVSTDEQAGDDHYGTDRQIKNCKQYARDNGFVIVAELADDYTGTVPIEERPEGSKVYAMLKNGEADVLIADDMSRIARPKEEGDEWEVIVLIRGLAKLKKEIHTCARGKLGTSFAELLMAVFDARTAGEGRRQMIELTSRGRKSKAEHGRVVGAGKSPYGYTYTYTEVVNPKTGARREVVTGIDSLEYEAAIVRDMYRWYVIGNGDDDSPLVDNAIARRLSEMGTQTPGERNGFARTRESGIWNMVTVSRILTDEVYAGVWRYRKTDANGVPRSIEEQIAVQVPAIISRDLWEAAQARREYNKKMSKRRCKYEYLLRGRIECGCGRNMTGCYNASGIFYYRCTSTNNFHSGLEKRTCTQKMVRCDILDYLAQEYILDIFSDPERFEQKLAEAQELEQASAQPKRDQLALVLDYIRETESEIDEIALALRRAKGKIADKLEKDQDEVNARYTKLCQERDNLIADLEQKILTDKEIADMLQYREDAISGFKTPTFEDKRYYLEQLRIQVVIKGEEATYTCRLPIGARVFRLHDIQSL